MKKLAALVFVLLLSTMACATGFYAITNNIGYQGTIWNITDNTGPWETSSPRDGTLYLVNDAPAVYSNYNMLASNWSEHHISNTNDSFLQLADPGSLTATSITGGWDSTMKIFTCTVVGQNATYANSMARFWQPDNGVAWGVEFVNYTYTFTATFAQAASADSGGYTNSVDPDTIVGSFTGQFVVTDDVNKNPITNGDLYGFDIAFSKAMFDALDVTDAYGNTTTVYSYFGTVPEPATMMLIALGGLILRKRS